MAHLRPLLLFGGLMFVSPALAQADPPAASRASVLHAKVEALEMARSFADEDPTTGAGYLQRALQALEGFAPEIAADAELQARQRIAVLTLARAHLNNGQEQAAAKALLSMYRVDPPSVAEVERFGPSLAALADAQRILVETSPRGTIDVQCHQPCHVFINERQRDEGAIGLPVGEYRVVVLDAEQPLDAPSDRNLQIAVELSSPDEVASVVFGEAPDADDKAVARLDEPTPGALKDATNASPQKDRELRPRGRILPRWLEIGGMVLGAGGIGAGAYLWKIDGGCAEATEDGLSCARAYTTSNAAIGVIASGSAILTASIAMLIVDEVRQRKSAKKRTLSAAIANIGQRSF